MDFSFSMGGLIPLWILGAPFVAGLISWASLPKGSRNEERDTGGQVLPRQPSQA